MTRLIDATRKPGPRDGTLMERIAAERFIPLYGPLYRAGVSQFERNLGSILEAAAAASVPAAVGELVSNARDQKPLASAAFDTLRPADDVYAEAQTLESQGKFAEAKAAYEKARDLDMLRFRAPSGMNVALRRVAALHGAVVVSVASAFEQASPHRLVGSNLMVDHLHPNLDGCFLLADAFYQSLRQNRILVADWDSLAERPAGHYRKTWPVTGLDSAIADLMIRQLMAGWPFRPAGTENRALKDFRPGSMNQALALDVILQKTSAEAAHYAHARHSEASGDTASAQRDYDAITRLVFIEAYAYLDRGLAFLRSGNKDNALRMFEKSLESEEIPLALRLAGSIHLEKGNFRESIRLLEKARGRNPARADVVHDLCLAYFRAGEPDKAADCYDALRKTNASGKWKDLEPLFRVR
jgi:tetratricopeptide (TPR) repeat protein